jgi:hypothetical protein
MVHELVHERVGIAVRSIADCARQLSPPRVLPKRDRLPGGFCRGLEQHPTASPLRVPARRLASAERSRSRLSSNQPSAEERLLPWVAFAAEPGSHNPLIELGSRLELGKDSPTGAAEAVRTNRCVPVGSYHG